MRRTLLAAVLIPALATTGPAQQPVDARAALRKGFADVSTWVTKAANLVPADRYTYRPAPTVRTFGQLVGHLVDSYVYYCAQAAGRNVEWADPVEKGATTKDALAPKLQQATADCQTTYGANTGAFGPLVDNVGHTNLHYGNMITYLRMLGLTPPSS